MDILNAIINQMVFLFLLIFIGFILSKFKIIPEDSAKVLSKLENIIFVPALLVFTFIYNCTIENVSSLWKLLVLSIAMVLVLIPISLLVARLCTKEGFLRKVATYGLAFSNFGFMGNAIVMAIYPSIFFEYTIFSLPFWVGIYLWGVPVLLIPKDEKSGRGILSRLKAFLNPMLIAMLIGFVLGFTGIGKKLPSGVLTALDILGDCMSPIAMLLTGIVVGKADVLALLKKWRLFLFSAIRLLCYPLATFGVLLLLPQNDFFTATFFKCAICMVSMPMGLTSIIVPSAYGEDTSDASGLAMLTHLFSIFSIPIMFMLLESFLL